MTLRSIALLLVLLHLTGCASVPSASGRRELGIFVREGADKPLRLQRETTVIPATLGTRFGISYVLAGTAPQSGAGVVHAVVWRFPGGGVVSPKTGVRSELSYLHACVAGLTCHTVWHFTDDWQLVPGRWTVEVWLHGRRIDSQVFDVQRP